MIMLAVRLLRRVFLPLVFQPHGLTGCGLPWPDLPSPPPCGWSTGFIATPRTVGRMPRQRCAPALPILRRLCSSLPISPTVARQLTCTLRISPERSRAVTYSPSRATICTEAPALRALAGLELEAVHLRAERDVLDGQRVAGFDRGIDARHDRIAGLHSTR